MMHGGLLAADIVTKVNDDEWNSFIDKSPDAWFWWRREWARYTCAYTGGTDMSYGVNTNGRLALLQPLVVSARGFDFAQHAVPWVLIDNDEAPFAQQAAAQVSSSYLRELAMKHGVRSARFTQPPKEKPSDVPDDVLPLNYEAAHYKTRIVDLSQPYELLWSQVRDSYRNLINRAKGKVDVISGPSLFERYELAHTRRAHEQRQTPRHAETYLAQRQWLDSNLARLYASTEGGKTVGFAYWITYKTHAYYMSGFSEPGHEAHALIWESLRDLKAHGIKTAEIGWQGVATTDKEKNIEFFKRGFGGADWTAYCIKTHFLTHREANA